MRKSGKKYHRRIKVIYFGDDPFRYIDEQLALGSQLCKRKYGIPEDLISVCIGYNASPAQQHINVTEKISLLDDETRKKYVLLSLRHTEGTVGIFPPSLHHLRPPE